MIQAKGYSLVDRAIERPKGTQDLLPDEAAALEAMARTLEEHFASYGYRRAETPVLEATELFLRKSGGELASHIYTFVDPGGQRLSLRPEFTASIIRAYLQGGQGWELPLRWHYRGPVFRYELPSGSPYRQFTQQGVELLGAAGPLADAEVISLACYGLRRLGLTQHRLAIGHVGIPLKLLAPLGLSERAKMTLVSHMGELAQGEQGLARVRRKLGELGLMGGDGKGPSRGRPGLRREGQALIHDLLQGMAPEASGSRGLEEIATRFLARAGGGDRGERVEAGLALVADLARVKGRPARALSQARQVCRRHKLDASCLEELGELAGLLEQDGLDAGQALPKEGQVLLDLGLARGLAYYTGMVFEVRYPRLPPGLPLCGGGRYDGLVRALGGGQDVPALGFAYSLERLAEAMRGKAGWAWVSGPDLLLAPADASAWGPALRVARRLREAGRRVELELAGRPLGQSLQAAAQRGIPKVIVVDREGKTEEHGTAG